MIKIWVFMGILLGATGCSAHKVNATLFLKETDRRFYDLHNNACLVSGYDVKPNLDSDTYRLVTYFSNCDVREERTLQEFEVQQWGIKKNKGNIGLH